MKIRDYINEKRLDEAKSLLKNTAYGVAEISAYVNFHSPSYFCAYFKKKVGMSPIEYRNLEGN